MAKGSIKRVAAGNAAALRLLAIGFVLVNTIHLLLTFGVFKVRGWRPIVLYVGTEAIAAALALVLVRMASTGQDLSQEGLTAYMFDVIYVTWFVHVMTAVVSCHFWWVYIVILLPFVFKGKSPFSRASTTEAGPAAAAPEPAVSKRQAKAQKRVQRGGAGAQVRRR
ncbi:hypothetical protein MCUN1_001986 [Malassezia cuniculi]|uniref:Transmembrane protein n=1 Tax=Malassezia cuniculi TaxID=948313 RepID=A0AAF0EYQ1_9BASI|nr:hypothetical protein MCUN1_001986 [Malassezia cuniculi]